MNIKDLLQDDALKALEDQIIMSFEGLWSKDHDYTDERSLIQVRKTIINPLPQPVRPHRFSHH